MGGDTDPETVGIAQAEKQRRDQVRGMAGGGVVAFKDGEEVKEKDRVKNPFQTTEEPKKEAPPVASRPKAAAPKPAVESSPYQAEFKRVAAAPNEGLTALKDMRESYKTEAALGVEGQMDRRQKLYDKYEIDPIAMYKNEKAEQQRALEEANGDAKKAEYMRWAQMWAKFGSTPGPVLKAALTAINDTVPDLLDDQTRARALQRSIKKSIYELDKAEYLEKKGKVDEASKLDQEAKGRAAAAALEFAKLQTSEYETKFKVQGQLAAAELGGQYDVQKARIQAAATVARSGGEGGLELKENKAINDALEKFDKRNQALVVDLENKIMALPEGSKYRVGAENRLKEINQERKELEDRLRAQMKRGTVSAEGASPKALPAPTADDIAFTAKKYGMSEEDVKKKLGIN